MTYEQAKLLDPTIVRVVVCAAVKFGGGENFDELIIPGPRHYSPTMHALFDRIFDDREELLAMKREGHAQGFIDQWGAFMSREEALEVAKANGQYGRYRKPQNDRELFSEDLY